MTPPMPEAAAAAETGGTPSPSDGDVVSVVVTPDPGRSAAARRPSVVRAISARYGVVGVWALMAVGFAVLTPQTFLSFGTFQTIFGSQTTLVFLCMASVCTFIVGEFDLSLASVMGLSATLLPVLAVNLHVPEPLAVVLALLAALAAGGVNALIIVGLGIDPIVTTLGMSVLLLGIAQAISNLTAVTGLSDGLAQVASANVLGLPVSFFYGLAVAIVFAVVLQYTPLGRHMTFVGANREVARLSGIRVQPIRVGAYLFAALSSGVGGVLLAATVGGFDPNTSGSYLLPALAATFLGTAVVQPGRFNPIGALVTIYFLVTGIVGLQLLGYSSWVSNVFYGAALIIAITVSSIARSRVLRR